MKLIKLLVKKILFIKKFNFGPMIKVMSIFGTRPEAIKMAPIIQEMERRKNEIESVICVTAQHREMLDSVLETFNIIPDYDLNIMKKGQTLDSVTGIILQGLNGILEKEQPDMVLVLLARTLE